MWLSMMAAGGVAAYAFTRRTPRPNGHGTGVIADRDSDTRRKLAGTRGIHVEESVVVNRPLADVYRVFRNFANLPRFLNHLEAVTIGEAGVSHWVAKGPAGINVEWDARVINEIDNKLIAWQSLVGSMISTAGSVKFDEVSLGTRVTVKLQYRPPAGKLGAAVARLLSEEPSQQIHEDLQRLKELLETGTIG